jgi:hypothetical protein
MPAVSAFVRLLPSDADAVRRTLVPLGLLLLVRLIPPVMAEHRATAAELAQRPVSYAGAAAIIVIWLTALALGAYWLTRHFAG